MLHRNAIVCLSEEFKLWEGEGSEAVQKFGNYVKANLYIILTNTQLMELWVKDSNECTNSGKEDHIASLITMCKLATVFEYTYEAKEAIRDRILHANQHLSVGKIGARRY